MSAPSPIPVRYRREGDQVRVLVSPDLELLVPAADFPRYREGLERRGFRFEEAG